MRRMFLAAVCLLTLAGPALAAETVPFTPAAFTEAKGANKPILIEIDASWCPNCAKQRPILAELSADPAFADLVIMKIDFDTQKDDVRALGANMQSTLIAFHGAAERGRAVGITDPAAIRELVAKSQS